VVLRRSRRDASRAHPTISCPTLAAVDQVIQVIGAVLILAVFAAAQFDLLSPH
jgi:hypothetical protein